MRNELLKISDYFDIKIPSSIPNSFLTELPDRFDLMYNEYYLDKYEPIRNPDYLLTFKFNNNKYLTYKIN